MQPEHIVWRLNPTEWTAIGTVVNAAVVIVLVVINWRYLRGARRQADAATAQADAARAQAEAASQSVRLIQTQMDDQARLNLIQTLTDLRSMQARLAGLPKMLYQDWGALPKSVPTLLPAHWASMVHVIERNAPDEKMRLRVIETSLLAASEKLKVELARDANYRSQQGLAEAAGLIEQAFDPLRRVLVQVELLTATPAAALHSLATTAIPPPSMPALPPTSTSASDTHAVSTMR